MNNRFRYAICRQVEEPRRAGENEAGIDFFIPSNLTVDDLMKANENSNTEVSHSSGCWPEANKAFIKIKSRNEPYVNEIILGAGARIIIPSGVCGLIEPSNSMLMAANKSGISTKKGLIYGAEIVDSTYTGEIHLNLINTSDIPQVIEVDEKAKLQFIHVPIYPTVPERIPWDGEGGFVELAKGWSERGSNWQGSTDKEQKDIEPYNDGPNA